MVRTSPRRLTIASTSPSEDALPVPLLVDGGVGVADQQPAILRADDLELGADDIGGSQREERRQASDDRSGRPPAGCGCCCLSGRGRLQSPVPRSWFQLSFARRLFSRQKRQEAPRERPAIAAERAGRSDISKAVTPL